MNMNEIIDGLSSSDYPAGLPCGNFNYGPAGGCGFGSWIWILLILFYSNNQTSANGCCCAPKAKNDCCIGSNSGCTSGAGGYLFLLVILFLCGGCGNDFGCGGYAPGFDAMGGCC